MNKSDFVAAYVLKRRPYQESSLIVDFFTLSSGKVSVIAKGALKSMKGKAAALQPFQPLLIEWSGHSSLKTLRQVDQIETLRPLSSTYLYCAYYVNELLDRLLPQNEVFVDLFGHYIATLNSLIDKQDQQLNLRLFEYQLLRAVGFLPDFAHDSEGRTIDDGSKYYLVANHGFCLVEKQTSLRNHLPLTTFNGQLITALSQSESIDCLRSNIESITLQNNKLSTASLMQEAKQLMRMLVDESLGGQPVKSRELFTKLKY